MIKIYISFSGYQGHRYYDIIDGHKTRDGKWMIKYKGNEIEVRDGPVNIKLLRLIHPNIGNQVPSISVTDDINTDKDNGVKKMSKFVMDCIIVRYLEHIEYERIINYAISSSKIQASQSPYSN